MVQLLSRRELLSLNDTFANSLISYQDAKYNPIYDCDATEKDYCIFKKFSDRLPEDVLGNAFAGNLICANSNGEKSPGEIIFHITNELQESNILVLSDYAKPWIQEEEYSENSEKILKKLLEYGVENTFKGGFKVSESDIIPFINLIFNITKNLAGYPEIFLCWQSQPISIEICQYGSLHFAVYDKFLLKKLNRIADNLGLIKIAAHQCSQYSTEEQQKRSLFK